MRYRVNLSACGVDCIQLTIQERVKIPLLAVRHYHDNKATGRKAHPAVEQIMRVI